MAVIPIFKAACGEGRNMTTFAKDISEDVPMSSSSLYRIASGENKMPVSDDVVAAIVKHADPKAEITFEVLRTALDEMLVKSNDGSENEHLKRQMRRRQDLETLARRVVLEAAINSLAKVQMLAAWEHDFDMALVVDNGEDQQTAYFEFTSRFIMDRVDSYIGRIVRKSPADNDFYYIVCVDSDRNLKNDRYKQMMFDSHHVTDRLRNANIPYNISLVWVFMSEDTPDALLNQVNIGQREGILSFESDLI